MYTYIEMIYNCGLFQISAAGESVRSKLEKITNAMKKVNAKMMVVGVLDEIAYLFNLR